MSVSDIVQVTITKETAAVAQAGFGVPLILSCEAQAIFAERAREYENVSDLAADGFSTTGQTYLMATAIMSQTPHPPSFVVGRRANLPTPVITLTPIVANLTVYSVTIDGVTFTTTSDSSATAAEIVAALIALINDVSTGSATVTASGTSTLVLTSKTAGHVFTLEVDRGKLTQSNDTTDPGIAADINAILSAQDGNTDWYVGLIDSKSKAEIVAAATTIEAMNRIFIAVSADDDVLTSSTSDVASTLHTAGRERTALIYHPKNAQNADAAWAGRVSPLVPGSETWAFKSLTGVDSTNITATEKTNLLGKKANYYRLDGGAPFTWEGTMASGEYIDITRLNDWTVANLQSGVFGDFIRAAGKIAFTDKGTTVIENRCRGVMGQGVANGGFVDGSVSIEIPAAASVDPNDKATRTFRLVKIAAEYAGAIHKTAINVNLFL